MPSPVGGLGACPQKKKSILRQKLCNSEQVLVLLSYITAESGGLSPSPESGGPIPLPPCSNAYGGRLAGTATEHTVKECHLVSMHTVRPRLV